MSVSLLPPGQHPDAVRDIPAVTRKTDRDFAHHVTPRNEASSRAAREEAREPTPDALLASDKLLAAKVAMTPLTELTTGAVLYLQSLRVVGYLSMLARSDDPTLAVTAATAETLEGEVPSGATGVPGTVPGSQSPLPTAGGLLSGGSASMTSLASIDSRDATPVVEVAAVSVPAGRRFSRRFVRLNGGWLLLRDFSLSPERAKAVLDAFRTLAASDGRPLTHALVNGKPYPLDKKDDHVG